MAEILWEAPLDSPTEAPLPCAHKGLPRADEFVGLEFWPIKPHRHATRIYIPV